jgi:hypothetical protein
MPMAKNDPTDDRGQLGAVNVDHAEKWPESAPNDSSSDPDLSGVLDKLQQVRAMDPLAEQQLIAELRKTPADTWPLVAEQFRASLAYRQQLAAKARGSTTQVRESNVTVGSHVNSANDSPTGLVVESRPSVPIGRLGDPRNADADGISSEALARATPYSTPVGDRELAQQDVRPSQPAEFAADGPSYPIPSPHAAAHSSAGNAAGVVQARFSSTDTSLESPAAAIPDPTSVPGGKDWRELVESAADDLSRRAAASPTTTAEVHQHASLRMLYLLTGDTEKALEPIPHISPLEQDYWSRQLFALATYLDHHSQPDDKRRAAASVIHLDHAVSSLHELGSLSLRNLSFCKNVYGYGAIEPCPEDRFSPGQQVTMYVEVENYRSTATEKGYRTSLGSSYEIVTEEGTRVGGAEIPDVEDFCRTRRRDFHIQYGLTLPATIGPGKYRLHLVIKDRQSDKIGHASAPFEIRGTGR